MDETDTDLQDLEVWTDDELAMVRAQLNLLVEQIVIYTEMPSFSAQFVKMGEKPYYAVAGGRIFKTNSRIGLLVALNKAATEAKANYDAAERGKRIP